MLIDQENAEWDSLAARAFLIAFILLIGVAIASYFISKALLRPLSELAKDLRAFSRDLEERRAPEEIFSKWNQTAKDKDAFTELLDSLVQLRSRLVGRLKMNDRTLSQMAHELKTPLAVIRVGTESLLNEATDLHFRAQLNEVLHEADRLSETITSFLNWSRFQQTEYTRLELHRVSLAECLRETCASLEHLYPQRIKLEIEGDFAMEVHRPHVEQVLRNLVSNSLKYSSLEVLVKLHNESFFVEDKGPGISDRILARLGEPFNSGATGTGLGIAWVKTLCDRYKWNLSIVNLNPGAKASVIFSTPQT
jgi:signal transduction histidine kinase